MGRRILAFFLGFIFAFVVIAGAIAIAVFAVKVKQYAPDSDKYLGDLANMSIYNVGQSIYKLYADKKTWVDENGKYYSLGDFCENYNIDINAVFGTEVPQEVLDIPAFEYFNDGGMERAMKQIKVSTLPAIINMFGGKNEDGTNGGAFSAEVVAELSKYSMFDLLKDENVGIAGVFANIRFADVMPSSFPAEDTDNKLMWAVGQTKIGGLLNGMCGSDSILLQLKAGGAFETLGGLAMSTVLGDSQYVDAVMGSGAVFADLIADDGTIRLDDIINGVSVGELLGCQKNEITNIDGYTAIDGQSPDAEIMVLIKTEGEGDDVLTLYIMSANGENWYEAELKCDNADEGHSHNAECYKYVWYSTAECVKEHDHNANGDMNKDGVNYARTDGLYSVLAALSITDFTSGNTDALMDELKIIKIRDLIDIANVDGVMSALVDLTIEELMNGAIDEMYLGEFFGFKRKAIQNANDYDVENAFAVYKERDNSVLAYYVMNDGQGNIAMSFDRKDWYVGKSSCDKGEETEHVHNENCFEYAWYQAENVLAEGAQNKLASKQLADIKYLNDDVKKMTLLDVFGEGNVPEMLKSIANVAIGELSEHIDTIRLGELLGYGGGLVCENTEDAHEHGYDCYAWTNGDGTAVTGIMAKLACKTVKDMNNMGEIINGLKLSDVLDPLPDVLKSLADVEIGRLNTAINEMRLGDFLEYEKSYACEHADGEEHDETCEYVWRQLKCDNSESNHSHGSECYAQVVGMMSKLADKKVGELNTLDSMIQEFTLRDVLGDSIPSMLLDVADKKLSEVGNAIQDIYLGSALGYSRKEVAKDIALSYGRLSENGVFPIVRGSVINGVYYMSEDGEIWYEASGSIKNKETVYGYVWYEADSKEVSGIVKALVNSKVGNVSNSIETMTLGEMGIGGDPENPNRILDALKDTEINKIGDSINNMQMATVLGYEKRYTCGLGISASHPTHADCPYVWIDENKQEVKGLNKKIADKTIIEMSGSALTGIAQELTIGDLIDSGMMTLTEEDEYKLNIMFCKENLSFTGEFAVTIDGKEIKVPKTYHCTMPDYLTYEANHPNTTAKEYFEMFTHKEDCTGTWRDLELKEFVSELLKALNA